MIRAIVVASFVLFGAACGQLELQPHITRCANGITCPGTQVCSPRGGCVDPDQIEQCMDVEPDTDCRLPAGDTGGCVDGLCVPRGCGNAVLDAGEACDDGNRIGGDGCSATCTSNEACGNGVVDVGLGEGCDCGDESFTGLRAASCDEKANSDDPTASCTTSCLIRGCGDGERAGLEDCDGADRPLTSCSAIGYYGGSLDCLASCRYDTSGCTGRCGDGTRNAPAGSPIEVCDGADMGGADCTDFGFYFASGLACNALCNVDVSSCGGTCGDNAFDSGQELCDPGESSAALSARGLDCTDFGYYDAAGLECSDSCQFDTSGCGGGYCGDDIRQSTEECDGTNVGTATCTSFGYYSATTLGCRANCTYDTSQCTGGRCGDSTINGPEQCDGSVPSGTDCMDLGYYAAPGLACSACRLDATSCTGGRCGDSVLNGTEQCDGASMLAGWDCTDFGFYGPNSLGCSAGCTFSTATCSEGICGDGVINPGEDCDQAALGGTTCTTFGFYNPAGLACTGSCGFNTSGCSQICGDDLVNGSETCDGAPAPNPSCTSVGYDAGQLGCASTCSDTYEHCRKLGLLAEALPNSSPSFGDFWGVGEEAFAPQHDEIWHRINGTWTSQPGANGLGGRPLEAVSGLAVNDVYAVGQPDFVWNIQRYDGSTWTVMTGPAGTPEYLYDVHAIGANNVWAVGESGTVLRYTGSWAKLTTPVPAQRLMAVWGWPGGNVWVVGLSGMIYRYDGSTWFNQSLADTTTNLLSVTGRSATEVYAVVSTATGNVIYAYDAATSTWGPMNMGTCAPPTVYLKAIAAEPNGSVIAVGSRDGGLSGAVCQLAGGTWHRIDDGNLGDVSAVGATGDYFFVGAYLVLQRTVGATWLSIASPTMVAAAALWGSAARNLYVAGGDSVNNVGQLRYYDGATWSSITVPASPATRYLNAVAGGGGWSVAVGRLGTIIAGSGTGTAAWTNQTSGTTQQLRGVWGDATNVHAVGDAGTLLRRPTGSTTWTALTSAGITTQNLNAVWGISGTVFAVGDSGTILQYSAGAWSAKTSSTTEHLYGVWGRSASDVYAVGANGTILHFDGSTWAKQPYRSAETLRNVWGSTGDLFVTTTSAMRQYIGGRWLDVRMSSPALTGLAVWATSDLSVLVGSNPSGGVELAPLAGRIFRSSTATETSCNDFWDNDADGVVDCADADCAASASCNATSSGGACQPVIDLACAATNVPGTTVGGASRWAYYGAGCTTRDETGREAFYRVRRTTAGNITMTLSGSTVDLDLIVSSMTASGACTPDSQCIASAQTSAQNPTVTFAAAANTDYIVVVDGYQGAAGTFSVSVACP